MKNLTELDEALLISLGLSKASARIVVNEIVWLRQEIADLEASRKLANEGAVSLAQSRDDWRRSAELLVFDITRTINENLHLADGDHCTLWRLKIALAEFERVLPKMPNDQAL
jgi:hypothetical protein